MTTTPYQIDRSQIKASVRRDGWTPPFAAQRPRAPQLKQRAKFDAKVLERSIMRCQDALEGRIDAGDTAMFLRQLLYIMPQPYDYKYPEIRYQDLLPISYAVPTGAKQHAYHQFDEMGLAKITDDYADDAPNVERQGHEVIGNVFGIRSSYSYSIQDLRSASMGSIPLDAMKAMTARRIIERLCDKLACVGDTTRSMYGIANDPNIITVNAANKAAGNGVKWATLSGSTISPNATPNEILNDINAMYAAIRITSKGTHEPDTLILGTQNHSLISTLRLDQLNMKTVIAYLFEALPWLKAVEYWPRLDTASGSSSELILMRESNRENFELIISQEFEQFPPQPSQMAFNIQCHKRWGEPQMRQPKSVAVMASTVA